MKRNALSLGLAVAFVALVGLAPAPDSAANAAERVLVEFAPGGARAVRSALQRAGGELHYQFDRLNLFAVTLPAAGLEGIARNPSVVAVAPDVPRYLLAQETPWGVDRVQAPTLWAEGATGSGVLVCIIDSGLYTDHEDLFGVTVEGGYPSGWSSDGCGHGTHVAGTVAAANNTTGVVGVTPGDASLYIVKVFGDDCGWAYESDLIDATDRCHNAGADIISMSLGGGEPAGSWEQEQFDWLWSEGLLSVAAAGNDGNTEKSYPASHDSVVSVAATEVNDVVADFSQKNDQVELAAPGVDVLSTVPWLVADELTVDGVTYDAHHIELAAYGTASGSLVDGGLCDGTGSWSGKVVLCERGDISFYDKVMNVQDSAGAAAVIYNNEPGNFYGTLGEGNSSDIVAISVSQEDGRYLVTNKLGFTGDVVSLSSEPGSGYAAWNGTSMATPHVSGVAALLWSSDATLTNADIREAMNAAALDLGASGRDDAYGYGLVQAYDAWVYLGGIVHDPVEADFSASPTSGFAPLSVDFTDRSTGEYDTCAWDFGDGNTSMVCDPLHLYETAGDYTVALTVSGPGGSDTLTRTNYITAYEPVHADFSALPTSGPAPLTVEFTNRSNGDYTASEWDFGDGVTSTFESPSHTYTAVGGYAVTLVIDGPGGTDTETKAGYITVEPLEDYALDVITVGKGMVHIDPDRESYVYGEAVTLTATAETGWSFAGWSGDVDSSGNPLRLTIQSDTVITATFEGVPYTLAVNIVGEGTVDVDPDQETYVHGEVVILTARAAPGWAFRGWSGDMESTENPLALMIERDVVITLTFNTRVYVPVVVARHRSESPAGTRSSAP